MAGFDPNTSVEPADLGLRLTLNHSVELDGGAFLGDAALNRGHKLGRSDFRLLGRRLAPDQDLASLVRGSSLGRDQAHLLLLLLLLWLWRLFDLDRARRDALAALIDRPHLVLALCGRTCLLDDNPGGKKFAKI